ncbi:MAG: YceK/YidQ family lipoprotein [Trichlorobacter sp.]|uniref:YceK/YidQ family lipoprotein n=1 Tax=Trichlorobacter sp. TaxID=2911007 RepID=UPI00256A5621|nr:YceK/YidQ family lipoprotein [Trichlorobacter sp.]MDK9717875.1 YceK/YidQ family lipoprotein [Trichlorobacter sp.]
MHHIRLYAAAVVLCLISGCSTFSETFADRPHASSLVYIGTQVDLAVVGTLGDETAGIFRLFAPFALLDLPLSLAADTLLLPYTITKEVQGPKRIPPAKGTP